MESVASSNVHPLSSWINPHHVPFIYYYYDHTPPPNSFHFASNKAAKKVSKPTSDRPLWYPGAVALDWFDGSLVDDYGFDPFGLGKPAEYLQYDLDSLDQNLAKNMAGDIIGTRTEVVDVNATPFQPYIEVFGLQRFRECELIHGR